MSDHSQSSGGNPIQSFAFNAASVLIRWAQDEEPDYGFIMNQLSTLQNRSINSFNSNTSQSSLASNTSNSNNVQSSSASHVTDQSLLESNNPVAHQFHPQPQNQSSMPSRQNPCVNSTSAEVTLGSSSCKPRMSNLLFQSTSNQQDEYIKDHVTTSKSNNTPADATTPFNKTITRNTFYDWDPLMILICTCQMTSSREICVPKFEGEFGARFLYYSYRILYVGRREKSQRPIEG